MRSAAELERMAERCRDAWAVLRCVGAEQGQRALEAHARRYDPQTETGTRDDLAEDMLAVAVALEAMARLSTAGER